MKKDTIQISNWIRRKEITS